MTTHLDFYSRLLALINDAIDKAIEENGEGSALATEMGWFREELGDFQAEISQDIHDLQVDVLAGVQVFGPDRRGGEAVDHDVQ